jgi:hypothetical protein
MSIALTNKRWGYASWLANYQATGNPQDYLDLPIDIVLGKLAIAYGSSRAEGDYITLPKQYAFSDIYNGITGGTDINLKWGEPEALARIYQALNDETGDNIYYSTYVSFSVPVLLGLIATFESSDGTGWALFDDGTDTGFLLYDDGTDNGILEFQNAA